MKNEGEKSLESMRKEPKNLAECDRNRFADSLKKYLLVAISSQGEGKFSRKRAEISLFWRDSAFKKHPKTHKNTQKYERKACPIFLIITFIQNL